MIIQQLSEFRNYAIGGKAHGLFNLVAAGCQVPPFVVLPAQIFDSYLDQLHQGGRTSEEIWKALLDFKLPEAEQVALQQIIGAWGFPMRPVVVRSSVADEDGAQDAFPGVMDSFLNLNNWEQVQGAIAQCAASAYAERAVSYRQQKQLTLKARPAVIVQLQALPQTSGVMFTTFPDYPQELAIHAIWGFGEGLVGGTLEPDEFYVLKKTDSLHRQHIAPKEIYFTAQDEQGLVQVALPLEKQNTPCLTANQIEELFQIGCKLEEAFGHPQDVEFVVDRSQKLWIVQCRPVTQPIPEVVLYDNSNIQESYCGVTTPLTFSFAQRAYTTVYTQTMHLLALPKKVIAAHEPVVTQLLGLVKGRIYYNINNWYKGLQLLPSFKQNKEDMERMMGLEEPVDFVENQQKSLGVKLKMLPGLVKNLTKLLWAFWRLNKLVPAFHLHFTGHYQRFYKLNLDELTETDLQKQKEILDCELLYNWTTPIINDFYVMMNNGKVSRLLKKAKVKDTEEFLSRYLSGDQQIESTQPTRSMQALAAQAWQEPELLALLREMPPQVHQKVRDLSPLFHEKVDAFISQYGDRTMGELKLETQTMRLQPQVFYQYLHNFLSGSAPPVSVPQDSSLRTSAQKELNSLLQPRNPWFRRRVRRSLDKLQQAIRYRESLRLERTRLFGMYRSLFLAMGQKLVQKQILVEPRDVFYLSEDEIRKALLQPDSGNINGLVTQRKMEFNHYQQEEVPSRVVVPSPPIEIQEPVDEDPTQLKGAGCSQGVVSGEIMVITDPSQGLNVAGKIICALRTDPGWGPLFPNCKGVLIEKGSSLSHSVILLRELGVPTIINIPSLTKRLQTGQHVLMDGSTGHIKVTSL